MLHRKLAVAVPLVAALVACESGSKSSTTGTTGGTGGSSSQTNSAPTLTALAISPPDASVPAGIAARFTATGTFSDGSSQDVTSSVAWTAADPTCAAARTDIVGAFDTTSACSTTISASDTAAGLSATVPLVVLAATLQSVAIAPIDPTLLVGTQLKLTASGYLSDGSYADLVVAWASSDPSVATVGSDGTVSAFAVGTTTVTATEPTTGASATTTVTVTNVPGVLSYLSVTPGSVVGGSSRTVTGLVALDSADTADKVITLSSSDPAASVPASVTIAAGSLSASFPVTTSAVTQRTKVTITAATGDAGDPTKTATLNVRKGH